MTIISSEEIYLGERECELVGLSVGNICYVPLSA